MQQNNPKRQCCMAIFRFYNHTELQFSLFTPIKTNKL